MDISTNMIHTSMSFILSVWCVVFGTVFYVLTFMSRSSTACYTYIPLYSTVSASQFSVSSIQSSVVSCCFLALGNASTIIVSCFCIMPVILFGSTMLLLLLSILMPLLTTLTKKHLWWAGNAALHTTNAFFSVSSVHVSVLLQ